MAFTCISGPLKSRTGKQWHKTGRNGGEFSIRPNSNCGLTGEVKSKSDLETYKEKNEANEASFMLTVAPSTLKPFNVKK